MPLNWSLVWFGLQSVRTSEHWKRYLVKFGLVISFYLGAKYIVEPQSSLIMTLSAGFLKSWHQHLKVQVCLHKGYVCSKRVRLSIFRRLKEEKHSDLSNSNFNREFVYLSSRELSRVYDWKSVSDVLFSGPVRQNRSTFSFCNFAIYAHCVSTFVRAFSSILALLFEAILLL